MKEEDMDELAAKPVKATKAGAKTPKAAKSKSEDDDDDDLDEEEDVALDIDEDEDLDIDDEEAYKIDKDFEEFDLPKSKTKSIVAGSKKKVDEDLDDDFKDLGLDDLGTGGGFDDDDDDF